MRAHRACHAPSRAGEDSTSPVFNLAYADIRTFVDDQRRLLAEGRFDYLEGNLVPDASGTGWRYVIEAATFFTPPQAPA